MTKPNDYPMPVLEAYDTIEKLLVHPDDQPLFKANSTISDVLLFILNGLYEHGITLSDAELLDTLEKLR